MRFLVDEMFGPDVAERLRAAGHDALHVRQLGLAGADDSDVLARAVDEDRVVITENAADFVVLLDQRVAAGTALVPVVIVLKRNLPPGAGAMNHALAEKLSAWAASNADPYRHVHWIG